MKLFQRSILGFIILALSPAVGLSQDLDINFTNNAGSLTLTQGNTRSAFLIAPGFPPMPGDPPVSTDQPGFRAPPGALSEGAIVNLRVIQPLLYWDGAEVANPTPLTTPFRVENLAGTLFDVTRNKVPDHAPLPVAVAFNNGEVHDHILFRLFELTSPDGAYGIVGQLEVDGHSPTEPFLFVFAQRITAGQRDQAVTDLLAASGIEPGALRADFDLDASVDGGDLADWETGYGIASAALLSDGDATRDAQVAGNDFLTWQQEASIMPLVTAVPEPSSLMLLGLAGSMMLGLRRGRH
ncbi:MAG: PEP-CTERM sorting domain-containing protein [Lacipirellulaceae bacterium]